jgi:hypothetical protein
MITNAARHLKRKLLNKRVLTRFNARNEAEAAKVLCELALQAGGRSGTVLVVGQSPYAAAVSRLLLKQGVECRGMTLVALAQLNQTALAGVSCIALAVTDSKTHLAAARTLTRNSAAARIPLEYVALPHVENAPLLEWDRYQNGDFVSPLLAISGSSYYDIYRESLTRFEQKTDIRDYLDLSQLLYSITSRGIQGNVAEFGSFKGHSGYLASRTLDHLGSSKLLYMFDMFDNFPAEAAGVDRFWGGTHKVDFESVRAKFTDRPNVRLVKGDFTCTLGQTDTGPLALAFVDCDSWRATAFLLENVWTQRLVPGGILALEDYGHGALLGNRVAVHEFFEGRRDAFTYFSQFSGFFVAVKLATATVGAA